MTTIAAKSETRLIKAKIEMARAKSNMIAVKAGMATECGLLIIDWVRNPALDAAKAEISKLESNIRDLELRLMQINRVAH